MATPSSVCVYCGSSARVNDVYKTAARRLGSGLARAGIEVVYGGGRVGLMGILADAALAAGGRVVGIIPGHLQALEVDHSGLSELVVVDTMHERKRMMAERADVFLALPGGIGTFEELFEVWTWRQLGYHDKPIGVLNVENYYDPLLEFLKATVEQQFLGDWQMELIRTGTDVLPQLPELVQAAGLVPVARLEEI